MNSLSKNINGLSVTTNNRVKLTVGQSGLLNEIARCVEQKHSLDWDLVVMIYYTYVKKTHFDRMKFEYGYQNPTAADCTYDILVEYQKQSPRWTYGIRALVRSWLLTNIGALVLKNQLIIIPVIEIGD